MNERIPPSRLIEFMRGRKSFWFIAAALILGIILMISGRGEGFQTGDRTEARLKSLCDDVRGVSDVYVMVTYDRDDKVIGVAVVCSGGDNAEIRLKLTNMICALFGIGADSVSILGSADQ